MYQAPNDSMRSKRKIFNATPPRPAKFGRTLGWNGCQNTDSIALSSDDDGDEIELRPPPIRKDTSKRQMARRGTEFYQFVDPRDTTPPQHPELLVIDNSARHSVTPTIMALKEFTHQRHTAALVRRTPNSSLSTTIKALRITPRGSPLYPIIIDDERDIKDISIPTSTTRRHQPNPHDHSSATRKEVLDLTGSKSSQVNLCTVGFSTPSSTRDLQINKRSSIQHTPSMQNENLLKMIHAAQRQKYLSALKSSESPRNLEAVEDRKSIDTAPGLSISPRKPESELEIVGRTGSSDQNAREIERLQAPEFLFNGITGAAQPPSLEPRVQQATTFCPSITSKPGPDCSHELPNGRPFTVAVDEENEEMERIRQRVESMRRRQKEKEAHEEARMAQEKFLLQSQATADALQRQGKVAAGGKLPTEGSQQNVDVILPLMSMKQSQVDIGSMGIAEAAALMHSKPESGQYPITAKQYGGRFEDLRSSVVGKRRAEKWRPRSNNQPIEKAKITSEDWLVFSLHNRGWTFHEIYSQWAKFSPKRHGQEWFRKRYARMKATYPDLVPNDKPSQGNEMSSWTTCNRNDEIEDRLRKGEDIQDLVGGEDVDDGMNQHRCEALSRRISRSDSRRPTTGGKSISKDLEEYILAICNLSEDVDDAADEGIAARQVSPPNRDDRIHYAYSVNRRNLYHGQTEAEWLLCGELYEDLAEANLAAIAEMHKQRDERLLPLISWNVDTNATKTGMTSCNAATENGRVEVRVERHCRTVDEDVMPISKLRWASREVFEVYETKVLVADSEAGDDKFDHANTATATDAVAAAAAAEEEEEQEAEEGNMKASLPVTENHEELDDNSIIKDADTTARASEVPSPLSQGGQEAQERERTSTAPKHIVRSTSKTTSPVGGLFGSRERANRHAAMHYLKLLREMDPNPERKRLSMHNYEQQRADFERMTTYCENLEAADEMFDHVIYPGSLILEEAGEDDDDDADTADSEGHDTPKIRVWVTARPLENPRNIF